MMRFEGEQDTMACYVAFLVADRTSQGHLDEVYLAPEDSGAFIKEDELQERSGHGEKRVPWPGARSLGCGKVASDLTRAVIPHGRLSLKSWLCGLEYSRE